MSAPYVTRLSVRLVQASLPEHTQSCCEADHTWTAPAGILPCSVEVR